MPGTLSRVLKPLSGLALLSVIALSTCTAASAQTTASTADITSLHRSFVTPPDDARIMMRWWWFGSAVTKPELEREMEAMKQGGIGGFEVQPVYPMALDDTATGFHNLPYLSGGFLDALHFANQRAHALGLRVDLTLASGWPYGGSYLPVTEAAGRLRIVATPVPTGANSIATPNIGNGEKMLTAFLAAGEPQAYDARSFKELPTPTGYRLQVPAGLQGPHVVLFFVSSRTGQQVKRAAVGANGFVLDHFDHAAIEDHLHTVGDKLMQAFGSQPPYAVFSDSLEVFGSDWTPDFLQEFQKRRGYDLTPYLPALVTDIGPKTADIRHDWGQTLTELIDANYLTPIREWAKAHDTRFRSQTYGIPAVTMSSNALVDLPEGEGPQWRSFSFTRWATSASHLYGRPITSSETWTWLHSPAFRATPLDMKAEADLFFLQGINQLIGHGWPYSPPSVGEPGWSFYAAAVFNDHNPWWIVMPDVTRYLQRCSYMLRQGKPDNDIALMLPTDDAYSQFSPKQDSVSGLMGKMLGPQIIPDILNSGYNLDFIDASAIDAVGVQHPVLILPGVDQISLEAYRKVEAYARSGGIVIATRRLPAHAPGLKADEQDTPQIQAISHELFEGPNALGHFLPDESQLSATLTKLYKPDMLLSTSAPEIGFIHRKLADSDVYFIVNTSNHPTQTTATFRVEEHYAQWWNPFSGEASAAADGQTVSINLAPYESRFLVFTNAKPAQEHHRKLKSIPAPLDIAADWKVTFPKLDRTEQMNQLRSWTSDEATHYYSGTAVYEKTIDVPAAMLRPGMAVKLDFGPGTPIEPATRTRQNGTRAWIDGPVREAAQVFVNGKAAGDVWHPPYVVDVTPLLHAGSNQLRIVVGNTGINTLAGRTLPNYRLLNSRYGERFTPQDMNNLQPLPSGIFGQLRLVAIAAQ
ncbi:MAG: glycosyl hydrolase [Acidobacteriaceae bacterium]